MTKQKKKRAKSKRRKIAFQGEPGANSHIACKQAYPDYEPLPCATFEDAFAAVRSRRAALAMIPIDNSSAGRVAARRAGIKITTSAIAAHSPLKIGLYGLPPARQTGYLCAAHLAAARGASSDEFVRTQ